jgi:hypothetical protein
LKLRITIFHYVVLLIIIALVSLNFFHLKKITDYERYMSAQIAHALLAITPPVDYEESGYALLLKQIIEEEKISSEQVDGLQKRYLMMMGQIEEAEAVARVSNRLPEMYDRHMWETVRSMESYLFKLQIGLAHQELDTLELDESQLQRLKLMREIDQLWHTVALQYADIDPDQLYDVRKTQWISFFMELSDVTKQLEEVSGVPLGWLF